MKSSRETIPDPFSFAPSYNWNGNDGSWSSFVIRVGTPAQDFEILPSVMGQDVLIPIPEGCVHSDPSNCPSLRGAMTSLGTSGVSLFQSNLSSTWTLVGIYTSNLENPLGYAVNASYGFDQVGLQVDNSGGLTMNHSVVGGIAQKDFYLGVLGLGPKPLNFSNFAYPQASLMFQLNRTKMIPSISFGYTAGAVYRFSKVPGTLTLGGYDSTRFEATKALSMKFASDDSRPLQVAIQRITGDSTLSGVTDLSPTPVFAWIDSALPYLWLPEAACNEFQTAFGLTYDNATNLYLVNDTVHTQLSQLNPTVTFNLGSEFDGPFLNIELPYAAFDLEANSSTRYFPIRRAANDTQYTLGRAFLQEAYIIVDYERGNFTIAQANFSATMPSSQIIRIISPDYPTDTTHESLSSGAIAGIVIGTVVAAIMIALVSFFILRRHRHRQNRKEVVPTIDLGSTGLGDCNKPELMSDGGEFELPGPALSRPELHTDRPGSEIDGTPLKVPPKWIYEAEGSPSERPGSEIDGGTFSGPPQWFYEVEGSPGRVYELPGTDIEGGSRMG